jgi:hypothetical protein
MLSLGSYLAAMDDELYEIAGHHGFAINSNYGIYKRGSSYNITKKWKLLQLYKQLPKQCKIRRTFVRKIVTELVQHCKLVPPDQKRQHTESGPGAKKLYGIDEVVVLLLYMEEPSQGLHTYAWLEYFTGTQVSDSLLSRFFNDAFPIR